MTKRIAPVVSLESQYPNTGSLNDKLQFLLNYAILSPSSHNTQPWLFKIAQERIELYADRTRSLPVADPEGRELMLSCGAALLHLRLAFRHFGYDSLVEQFPDVNDRDLLAWIRFGAAKPITVQEEQQFQAIAHRHTHRFTFADRPIPTPLLDALQQAVSQEGATLVWLREGAVRQAVAELVGEGDRLQAANPAYREELSNWIRPNYSHYQDGIPGYAFGMNSFAAQMMPLFLKEFNWGQGIARKDQELALESPTLAVLTTPLDTPRDWLAGGQALASLLLLACSYGLRASFLNQPIQQSNLRPQLQTLLRRDGVMYQNDDNSSPPPADIKTDYPQLLLRLGYGSELKATPRRTVSEVLVDS